MKSLQKIICLMSLLSASVAFASNINISAERMYIEKDTELVHYQGNVNLAVHDTVKISADKLKESQSTNIKKYYGNVKIVVNDILFFTSYAEIDHTENQTIITMSEVAITRP